MRPAKSERINDWICCLRGSSSSNKFLKNFGLPLLFFGGLAVWQYSDYYNLKYRGHYTVGVAKEMYKGKGGKRNIQFEFHIGSKSYICYSSYPNYMDSIVGKTFLVVYSHTNPSTSKMLFDLRLDSVKLGSEIDTLIERHYSVNLQYWNMEFSDVVNK
jgi:hypothetical protein